MAEFGHAGRFVVGWQFGLVRPVAGVDFRADGLVFVGDDAVGDAGVDEGHLHAAVSEQRGDRAQRSLRCRRASAGS